MTFQELNLLPQLLKAVDELGYIQPSPIQAQAIPPVLKGKDLIGCAQTGTGKTAAFAIPILQRLHGHVSKPCRSRKASTSMANTWSCATPSSSAAWARPPRWRPCKRAWTSW